MSAGNRRPPAPVWIYAVAYTQPTGVGMLSVSRPAPITDFDTLVSLANNIAASQNLRWAVITNHQLLRVDHLDFHGMPTDPDHAAARAYEAWIGAVPGATAWDDLPDDAQNTWHQVAYAVQHALGGLPAAF